MDRPDSLFGEHLVMFRSFPWIFFVLKYMEEPQPGWTSMLNQSGREC